MMHATVSCAVDATRADRVALDVGAGSDHDFAGRRVVAVDIAVSTRDHAASIQPEALVIAAVAAQRARARYVVYFGAASIAARQRAVGHGEAELMATVFANATAVHQVVHPEVAVRVVTFQIAVIEVRALAALTAAAGVFVVAGRQSQERREHRDVRSESDRPASPDRWTQRKATLHPGRLAQPYAHGCRKEGPDVRVVGSAW